MYAALRDCYITLQLDPNHMKAHFRLAKCLFELKCTEEAYKCLSEFKLKYSDQAHSRACKALDMDIQSASQEKQTNHSPFTVGFTSGIFDVFNFYPSITKIIMIILL